MARTRFARGCVVGGVAALALLAGVGRADDPAGLRRLVEEQARKIEDQKRKIEAIKAQLDHAGAAPAAPDPDAVKKITADYLKDNPGAGLPPSVQTVFWTGQGFVIRSAPDPAYVKWDD